MSADISRRFVDTNVLVYAHDVSAGRKHELARRLVEELWDSCDGALSVQVLQEFYVTVTRKVPKPVSPDEAKRAVSALGLWAIHSPTAGDVIAAIEIEQELGVSFWDAMIIQSAYHLGCECILSEDLAAGQRYRGLTVINPFE